MTGVPGHHILFSRPTWEREAGEPHLPLAGVGAGQHLEERVQSSLGSGVSRLGQLFGAISDPLLVKSLVAAHEGHQAVLVRLHPLQLGGEARRTSATSGVGQAGSQRVGVRSGRMSRGRGQVRSDVEGRVGSGQVVVRAG